MSKNTQPQNRLLIGFLITLIILNLIDVALSYGSRSLLSTCLEVISILLLGIILGYYIAFFFNMPARKKTVYFDMLDMSLQFKLAQDYIRSSSQNLKLEYPEITGIAAGRKNIKGKNLKAVAIIIQVAKKEDHAKPFPLYIQYKGFRIPTDVQQAGIAKAQFTNIASGVSRKDDLMYGTLGIPIKKGNELFYMSCYHVYCNKELAAGKLSVENPNDPTLISPCFLELNGSPITPVGTIIEGCLTESLDVAIMKPQIDIIPNYSDIPGPIYYRTLTRDQENKIILRFRGNGSKAVREGFLRNIAFDQYIDYEGKKNHHLINLIQIDRCASDGDSGAAVCDLSGNYIGFVVASDNNFTYIIAAYTIENLTNYKFT